MPQYRFSGHETFPCRYAWLPKAYRALDTDSKALADDESAMVALGVGKNMVRAIRFWVQAAGIAEPAPDGGLAVTELGRRLLADDGFDPFLEDVRTLWLIHWKLSTRVSDPLFAWDYLLNRWQHPDMTRTRVLEAFDREARRIDRKLSPVTLEQHFDTFLHTYLPTRGRKGDIQEDNLDCPLVELNLLMKIGDRESDGSGRREPIYVFRREAKPEITPELFIYCLDDFWHKRKAHERTLTFRDVSVGHGGPGQIFKLPEWDVRERLEGVASASAGAFEYHDSAQTPQVSRPEEVVPDDSIDHRLARVYGIRRAHA
jgi:hypothetical protein